MAREPFPTAPVEQTFLHLNGFDMALNYWTRTRWQEANLSWESKTEPQTNNTVLKANRMISGLGTGAAMGTEGFSKALQNSVTLSTLQHVEHWNTSEHFAALAEHLQEGKMWKAKENTDTTVGWPQPIYFKACYLSFWNPVRTFVTSHTKAPLSHKYSQQDSSKWLQKSLMLLLPFNYHTGFTLSEVPK